MAEIKSNAASVEFRERHQDLRQEQNARRQRHLAVHRGRQAGHAARAFGLRQDDDAADDRRAGDGDVGPDPDRRRRRHAAAGDRPRRVDGVPVLRAVPAHDGERERRIRPALLGLRQEGSRPTAPAPGSSSSASPASATACPASFRAASSSASPSPARWCSSRRCCSSTSRSPTSTPSSAAMCARRSARSSRSSA